MSFRTYLHGFSLLLIVSFSLELRAKDCLVCEFNHSELLSKHGEGGDPCDDLFSAACVGKNGEPKQQHNEEQKSLERVNRAKEITAKKMGYKDLEEALRARFKAEGLELIEDPDPELMENLTSSKFFYVDSPDGLFKSAQQCDKRSTRLGILIDLSLDVIDLSLDGSGDISTAERYIELADESQAHITKYQEMDKRFIAKDIPQFIRDIGEECFFGEDDDGGEKEKLCRQFALIKREGVRLYRLEGHESYEKRAKEFVNRYYSLLLLKGYESISSSSSLERVKDKLIESCWQHNEVLSDYATRVKDDFLTEISTSRTTVESLIADVYSSERRKLANQIYKSVKSDAKDLMPVLISDSEKRGRVLDGFDSLELSWKSQPEDSKYRRMNAQEVLDEGQVDQEELFMFWDSSLSFFTEKNASYMPAFTGKSATVNIMPVIIDTLEKNPISFLAVLAHEVGHEVSPSVATLNGHDLKPEYQQLLSCYRSTKSIKLLHGQADEVTADYIASEILARQINKLPPSKKRDAVFSAMSFFCQFHDEENERYDVYCRGSHPDPYLRISGIYGANPSIRRVLGCKGDSPTFKTCGLKRSILDTLDSLDVPDKKGGSPHRELQDSQGTGITQ